ncbi:PTS system, N-acetylgalactosamine-specific, IIB component [Spiroplasma clarkii]|uniref:PTS system, N-acetylgalactosamine-specific IIB component n=1 Tax=Spiroplasma clarkii TaxID=2139 RepID=A0A1Y0L1C2_9MOLU|nr:PTS sugar transporter subunit IIB [Spiroplasma clarkii]ARU91814.1 PTS system, N-acetylgalactosamine-specific, IIB component [Spiroplasma clarkii]ATX71179.1 PTS system, N-acetylgalactosamine-specific IIB component [Spiroplasma clarkii]
MENKINIVASRIDQRLLHGQATMFVKKLNANLVIVCNDAAATDKIQQNLMKVCISSDIGLRFFTVRQTIDLIWKASPEQKIIIIIGNVKDAYDLVMGGVPLTQINIGNIHSSSGRKKLNRFINLSEEESKMLAQMYKEKNVKFSNYGLSTDVTDSPLDWEGILNKWI